MRRPVVPLLAAFAVLLAGCGEEPARSPMEPTAMPTMESEPSLAEFIAAADLPPCPPSTMKPVAGGLPDLTLGCLGKGPEVALDRLPRKPYVINVWASWCTPCRTEMPLLVAAHRAAGDRVGFLGIDFVDQRAAALAWSADIGVTFASGYDPNGDIRGPMRIVGPPVTFFVRTDGTLAGRKVGEFRSEKEVRDAIAQYLGVRL